MTVSITARKIAIKAKAAHYFNGVHRSNLYRVKKNHILAKLFLTLL